METIERRRLTAAEARALLELAAADPATDLLVALALGTGARVGELCALDWADVSGATVTVRYTLSRGGVKGPPKSQRGRRSVTLLPFAIAALERERARRPEATGPLLVGRDGRRLPVLRAGKLWAVLRARAGLVGLRFHDLRGTVATLALQEGAPVTEVARWLGHDPAVLMRTYAGAIPGGRAAVAAAIERALR